jgi:hypothetical protein
MRVLVAVNMDEDEVEIDVDWDGWNEFVELDQTEEQEEEWGYDDEDARLISALLRESIAADVIICLLCGEILTHCGCD